MTGFISLGSNLGNRSANLIDTLSLIREKGVKIEKVSGVYETSPMYKLNQNRFYNQVAKVNSNYEPDELLNCFKKIECDMGRDLNSKRYSERIIDIDILTYGEIILESKNLHIPHLLLHERLFVLVPWNEIASNYIVPKYEKTVKKLTDNEKNQYHLENMKSADLVLVDIEKMPKTHDGLKEWVIRKSREKDYLLYTDVAKDVQDIIAGGPVPKHIKPIWPFIAFTAFNTLPKEFKNIYGIKDTKLKSFILEFNLKFLKYSRPFLPPFFRLIAPARWAKQRITKKPDLRFSDKAKF